MAPFILAGFTCECGEALGCKLAHGKVLVRQFIAPSKEKAVS